MKRILDHKSFISKRSHKINEVFTNDVPWGDSLIGRLINSLARKAAIAYNNKRIDGVLKRLESHFDGMLETGKIVVEKEVLEFTKISTYLGQLKRQVEDGEETEVLVSTCGLLLSEIENYKFDKSEEMTDAINEFIEFLKSLKDGVQVEKDEEDGDVEEKKRDFFESSRKFLQSIVSISDAIERSEKVDQEVNKKREPLVPVVGKEYIFTNTDGKKSKVKVISLTNVKDIGIDKKWLTNDDKTKEKIQKGQVSVAFQDEVGNYRSTTNAVDPSKLVPVAESIEINESKEDSKKKSINAWSKIRSIYNKELKKHIGSIRKILSSGEGDSDYETNKGYILTIGKQVVLNLSTIGKPISYQDLIKEGLYDNDIPKSISLFIRYILPLKEELGILVYGHLRNAKDPIENLFSSFENMKKFLVKKEPDGVSKEGQKEDSEKQNASFSYSNFLLIIEKNKYISQIKNKFDEIFTEDLTKEFNITETKRVELESSVKKSEIYRISDFDLVEISRIFNRAFRLHTPGTIPSGRSEGRVSVSVFNEYEFVGDGGGGSPDRPGSGPYRNKKIFDTWENGVKQKITTNPKYRPLFEEVMIVSGGSEVGKKKKLLTFMTEILEDTDPYKPSGMSKLLLEYFGVESGKTKVKELELGDQERVEKTADKIKVTPVSFQNSKREDLKNGSLYKLTTSQGDGFGESLKESAYFKVIKFNNDFIWGILSTDFPYDRTNINLSDRPKESGKYLIFKISKSKFFNKEFMGDYEVHGENAPGKDYKKTLTKVQVLKNYKDDTLFTEIKFKSKSGKSEKEMEFEKYINRLK